MKFKEYFVDDITYGMLVIGASMEETFDHILFCGDWELAVARARKDEGCLKYSLTFIDDDDSIGITAIKYGADWSIVFNRECDDVENLDEYPALANAFGEYIKQIAIEYITK